MRILIRNVRQSKGLTQQELAVRVGVSKTCMCRWENWKKGMPVPSLRTLLRIAKALDICRKCNECGEEFFEELITCDRCPITCCNGLLNRIMAKPCFFHKTPKTDCSICNGYGIPK